jgi:hypothetical protein
MMRPKNKKKNAEYRTFIDTLPCHMCGSRATHHHESIEFCRGTSSKEPDTRCVPLCHQCHNERHSVGFVEFYNKKYPCDVAWNLKTKREFLKGRLAIEIVKYIELFIERKRYGV